MKINVKEAGKRIKSIRDRFGYSMLSFALLLDMSSASTVNNWEKGNNLPNKTRLEKIAVLGNTSVNWIKFGTFQDYVHSLLVKDHQNIYLTNKHFMNQLLRSLKKKEITYCQDIEIMAEYRLLLENIKGTSDDPFSALILVNEETAVYNIETNDDYRQNLLPMLEGILQHPSKQRENRELLYHFLALLSSLHSDETIAALDQIMLISLEFHKKYSSNEAVESGYLSSTDKKQLSSVLNQFFNLFSKDLLIH